MCHSNMYIEFGPNINFLVGSNGSGKSAVITALALGLAASARSTSRASSIQSNSALLYLSNLHINIMISLLQN